MADYEVVSSKRVYEGKLIQVDHDIIKLPNGQETLREIVVHDPAAAVLPVDSDGKLILVRQYRHPVKGMTLEMPAGICEKAEAPLACASRELEEETGMKAEHMTFLFRFYASIGFCTEELFLYLAEGLYAGTQHLDEDEFVSLERYSPEEAYEMILHGEIIDSKTIAAVLYYLNKIR